MEKCRVCYQEISKDKVASHIPICDEVEKLKKDIRVLIEKMEEHSRHAYLMQSSLTTNANAQQKLHKKQGSRGSIIIAHTELNSPVNTCSTKETCGSHTSPKNEHGEYERTFSEEEPTTPSPSKLLRPKTAALDAVRKLPPEEYLKFMEETNKSLYAINKVISFSDKILRFAFMTSQFEDLNHRALNEMDICYKDISDVKVQDFLNGFIKDLAIYVAKKTEFSAQKKKLNQISRDKSSEEIRKEKFLSNKGGSLKKLQGSLKSLASLNRSGGPGDNSSSLKDHTRSPSADKKKPIVPKDHQFFSPITAKKQLMGSGSGFLRSPVLDAYGSNNTSKGTPSSTKRVEMKSSFLQMNLNTNLNHLGGSHQLMKKSIVDEGASLKDLIKKAVGQNNTTPQKTMDQFNTKIPIGTPLNTPLSPHQTKQMLNKERDRKSRFSVGTNPLDALKAAAGEQIHREGRHEMTSIPEETQPKLAKTRAKSLKMLKDLQKAEDTPAVVNVFTSLADTKPIWDKSIGDFNSDKLKKDKLKKKKSGEDNMGIADKRANSDPNHKWKRTLPLFENNQVTIDSFRFIKFLGRGAYGVVWLVEHKLTKDLYAMKIIDAEDALTQNRMCALEAEQGIYEVLQGDFVVKAVYTFEHDNYICFVTEFMVGGDFNKILEEFGRLDKEHAQFYFAELILAVESLHADKIIHRDLKPDNILMDANGHIRLTDFGLSDRQINVLRDKAVNSGMKSVTGSPLEGSDSNSKLLTRLGSDPAKKEIKVEYKVKQAKEGEFKGYNAKKGSMIRLSHRENGNQDKKVHIVGTPDYMAPEILNPEKYPPQTANYDKALDWWSMGVILYEFLVGIPPFNADTREEIFDNIRNLRMEWPPIGDDEDSIPADAVDLIKKLLTPNPNKRLGINGSQEIKNHRFFENFDWEGVTSRPAPIIPDCQIDLRSVGLENNPFNDSEYKKKRGSFTSTGRKKFFNMTRTELLHKITLQKVQTPQKQKSLSSKKLL